MKRILSLFIAVVLVMSLAACSIPTVSNDAQKPSDILPAETTQQQPNGQDTTIEETVLVDESGVKITAKSLSTDELFGAEIKLLIENNSGKDLTFQCRNSSVNGYMVETMMSVDVVNGKKANDALTFTSADLEACGIDTIADMEFSFHIFTSDDWETYLDTQQIQLKTSAAETYEYTFDDSGDIAYDGNNIKVIIKGLSEDSSVLGPGIVIYIENTSDNNITVQTRDVSINGFMADAIYSQDVMIGKRSVSTISFISSDLEENGISSISDVELSFKILDCDTWDDIVDTEPVKIIF